MRSCRIMSTCSCCPESHRLALERIVAYIENNPVKAGLAARPEEYAGRVRRNARQAPRRVSARQTRVSGHVHCSTRNVESPEPRHELS